MNEVQFPAMAQPICCPLHTKNILLITPPPGKGIIQVSDFRVKLARAGY